MSCSSEKTWILACTEDPTKTWENPTQEKSIYLCSYLYYLEPGIQLYDYFLKNWEVTSAFVVDWICCDFFPTYSPDVQPRYPQPLLQQIIQLPTNCEWKKVNLHSESNIWKGASFFKKLQQPIIADWGSRFSISRASSLKRCLEDQTWHVSHISALCHMLSPYISCGFVVFTPGLH